MDQLGNSKRHLLSPFYVNNSTRYFLRQGRAAGYIYECHIDSEDLLGYTQWLQSPVNCLRYTNSSRWLVSGAEDGVVRIQEAPLPGQLSLSKNSKYWEAGLHDGFYGVVGGVVTSFDDQYLGSVAYDGSFFVHDINLGMPSEDSVELGKQKAVASQMENDVVDVSMDALSIEEQREKSEQDLKLKLAMEKKNVVLAKVDRIRVSLAKLLKEMGERPSNEQLPLSEFEIDPNMRMYGSSVALVAHFILSF